MAAIRWLKSLISRDLHGVPSSANSVGRSTSMPPASIKVLRAPGVVPARKECWRHLSAATFVQLIGHGERDCSLDQVAHGLTIDCRVTTCFRDRTLDKLPMSAAPVAALSLIKPPGFEAAEKHALAAPPGL
jgi:hypothetical protein